MTALLDLGTGAQNALTTTPQAGASFFLSPQPATMSYLSVVMAFAGGLLPPDIHVAVQALSDDGTTYGTVATARHGNLASLSVQTLPVHSFAAADGDRTEFLFIPSVRLTGAWRVLAWAASAPPEGHRVTVYSALARIVGVHVSAQELLTGEL